MNIKEITIIGGVDKSGMPEKVPQVNLKMGSIISIVGATGSGKTAFINDIELFANENTPTKRKVLFNDVLPSEELLTDPSQNPIALITQHTNFLSDLPVKKFLEIHARVRNHNYNETMVEETLDFANQLTGEAIIEESGMTELSGGQTRALLIADAVIIGNSPILLLDEIENAGIHRAKALELLKQYEKIFVFVTHDPRIALLSDFRIVMKNGAMEKVIFTQDEEKELSEAIKTIDDLMLGFKKRLWEGKQLHKRELSKLSQSLFGLDESWEKVHLEKHHDGHNNTFYEIFIMPEKK